MFSNIHHKSFPVCLGLSESLYAMADYVRTVQVVYDDDSNALGG